jgi:hypothetical protein
VTEILRSHLSTQQTGHDRLITPRSESDIILPGAGGHPLAMSRGVSIRRSAAYFSDQPFPTRFASASMTDLPL